METFVFLFNRQEEISELIQIVANKLCVSTRSIQVICIFWLKGSWNMSVKICLRMFWMCISFSFIWFTLPAQYSIWYHGLTVTVACKYYVFSLCWHFSQDWHFTFEITTYNLSHCLNMPLNEGNNHLFDCKN